LLSWEDLVALKRAKFFFPNKKKKLIKSAAAAAADVAADGVKREGDDL
jgi:hypothetical protein